MENIGAVIPAIVFVGGDAEFMAMTRHICPLLAPPLPLAFFLALPVPTDDAAMLLSADETF